MKKTSGLPYIGRKSQARSGTNGTTARNSRFKGHGLFTLRHRDVLVLFTVDKVAFRQDQPAHEKQNLPLPQYVRHTLDNLKPLLSATNNTGNQSDILVIGTDAPDTAVVKAIVPWHFPRIV